jgi:hypothetical protein
MTHIYSSRTPTTVAGSVQKRKTLIISVNDPRNNPRYIANYVGEVVVLSEIEFRKYLTTQNFTLGEDPSTTTDNGADVIVSTLHPPTNLYWDPTSTADTEYISSGSTPVVNIIVTFDAAVDEVTTDGTISYEAEVAVSNHQVTSGITGTGGGSSVNAAGTSTIPTNAALAKVTASTISYITKTANQITLKWKPVSGVTGYEVGVTGANQKGSSGRSYKLWFTGPAISSDKYHHFTIYPETGTTFQGHYSFTVAARFNQAQSEAVSYSGFTI